MTIPYADEIQRMWRRGKAVRRAYAEHLGHVNGLYVYTNCRCIHCRNWRLKLNGLGPRRMR